MMTYICDNICKERIPGRTQEQLDAICEKCAVDRFFSSLVERLGLLLSEVDDYVGREGATE